MLDNHQESANKAAPGQRGGEPPGLGLLPSILCWVHPHPLLPRGVLRSQLPLHAGIIIVPSLIAMKNTKHLAPQHVATNELLYVVANTCRRLTLLDISYSTQVTRHLNTWNCCGAFANSEMEREDMIGKEESLTHAAKSTPGIGSKSLFKGLLRKRTDAVHQVTDIGLVHLCGVLAGTSRTLQVTHSSPSTS